MNAGSRVAAAPISWGVSELATWGLRLPAERVLSEMAAAGFGATELGPPGYLPEDPHACREMLDRHGLRLVAGFLAVVLHESRASALGEVGTHAAELAAAGAEMLVLAAALPGESYERHDELTATQWRELLSTLTACAAVAAGRGVKVSFHPHAGTAVESRDQVNRLLDACDVDLCLDTGHLLLGGTDPVELARRAGRRISHVHLKDVDLDIATSVRAGELSYSKAVRDGLYRPLGEGDLDVSAVVTALRDVGYQGWFVLEQDTALTAETEPADGPGAAARQSLEYFRRIDGAKQHITVGKEE